MLIIIMFAMSHVETWHSLLLSIICNSYCSRYKHQFILVTYFNKTQQLLNLPEYVTLHGVTYNLIN